jgi:hypothetical protein
MRRVFLSGLFVCLGALPLAAQQSAFVIRLGRDTAAVERIARTGTTVTADAVIRQPRTTMRHLQLDYRGDRLAKAEMVITRPDAAAGAAPLQRSVATFVGDSMIVETRRDTAVVSRRFAVPATGIFIVAGAASSFLTFDQLAMRLRASRQDSIAVQVIGFGGVAQGSWSARTLGRDSVWIFDGNNTFHAKVDRDGHIMAAAPYGGTQQFTVERVATADIAALATAFAARDAQGQQLGLLSPRDTVRASVAGANLMVDYGRPSKRGRQIFGTTIVPYGEVWRTGANAATQFRTDKTLEIGGVTLPAGFYTLWTVPSASGWKLLINSQTGQWGTAHDATKDLFQLPMATSTLPQSVERFTITVVPSAQGGTLNLDWDTTRASIPFTVR